MAYTESNAGYEVAGALLMLTFPLPQIKNPSGPMGLLGSTPVANPGNLIKAGQEGG